MNTNTTRFPSTEETLDVQKENHRARCLMAPDAVDMKLAATLPWQRGDIACNRALVAGPAPRRDAIAQFDLSDWKSAVGAVTAVGYGQLPNGISGHDGLLQLVTEAKNQEIAGLLVKSFKAGYGDRRGQPGDYATSMAIRTLEEAVMPEGYRHPDILSSSLSGLADYCGLSTLAREYIYSGDGFAWLASTPLRYDLDAVLAQGW